MQAVCLELTESSDFALLALVYTSSCSQVSFGLVWFGLVQFVLVRFGLTRVFLCIPAGYLSGTLSLGQAALELRYPPTFSSGIKGTHHHTQLFSLVLISLRSTWSKHEACNLSTWVKDLVPAFYF